VNLDEIEALGRQWDAAMSRGDAAAAAAMATEDVEYRDHRALGWEPLRGRQQLEAWYGTFGGTAVLRVTSEVMEARGDRAVARQTATFRAEPEDGGGEGEVVFFVTVTYRDGRMAVIEIFAAEEEARAALG